MSSNSPCKCSQIARLAIVAVLFTAAFTSFVSHSSAQGDCTVQITPYFTEYYGDVMLDGASAPIGTLVEAYNTEGVQTGCFIVSIPGSYGYMRVFGADSETSIPGMSSDELVIFRVDGVLADTAPADVRWSNDKDQHQVSLSAVSPPDAVIDLQISIVGGNVDLSWSDVGGTVDHYEVWRSSTPYFTPGDAGSERIAPNVAPNPGGMVNYTDTTHHLAEPETNDYYLVLAVGSSGIASAESNRVAAFDFSLTPGE